MNITSSKLDMSYLLDFDCFLNIHFEHFNYQTNSYRQYTSTFNINMKTRFIESVLTKTWLQCFILWNFVISYFQYLNISKVKKIKQNFYLKFSQPFFLFCKLFIFVLSKLLLFTFKWKQIHAFKNKTCLQSQTYRISKTS